MKTHEIEKETSIYLLAGAIYPSAAKIDPAKRSKIIFDNIFDLPLRIYF
jgi:hypothetical protein